MITLGRAADPSHVLWSDEALAARGIERVTTTRGGDVTWHGPGQLVAYPIVAVDHGVLAYVEAMARAVVDVAARLGIDAEFRRARPGVWVGAAKLCAFGVHVHRRVAIHGLALNATASTQSFAPIVPCGLGDSSVCSIADLAGRSPPLPALAALVAEALASHLGRRLRPLVGEEIHSLLSPSAPLE